MTKWSEYLTKMELWRTSLKKIEGNFGTGVVAYFVFLRWLMILNLLIFAIIFVFIILPQMVLVEPKDSPCDLNKPPEPGIRWVPDVNHTDSGYNESIWMYPNASIQCCREAYINEIRFNHSEFSILHLVQGTGFMEKTLLFYGMYTNQIYGYDPLADTRSVTEPHTPNSNRNVDNLVVDDENNSTSPIINALLGFSDNSTNTTTWKELFQQLDIYYDLPLAYIIVTIVCYLYTLVAIVKAVAHEFKDRLVEGEGQFYQYCNLIFGGWDFCIHNEKSAQIKHKALYNEIQSLMHLKRYEFERNNRTRDIMFKLYLIRIMVNFFVCVILVICGVAIYVLFNMSLGYLEPNFNTITRYRNFNVFMSKIKKISSGEEIQPPPDGLPDYDKQFEILFYEFLPYVCIVFFNLLVPILFNYLIQFEQYSPLFVIKMNLFRTVGLRLSSLAVLISRFYYLISSRNENSDFECYNVKYGTPQCWETFVGQQFFKLFIVDFVTHIFVTFFVNFPRALIARNMNNAFARFIEMDFELSKHVLDVVYSQTICWLGTFYAPFLPAIAAVLIFFMFYIKKFACLVNSKPSAILYRASRSNSLFMIILLLSFTISIIPVVYAIAEIMPSRSCGPFRGLQSTWDRAIEAFMKLPEFLRNIVFFFGTSSFAIPCFIVLILFLYYYYSVSAANKHMVQVLKNQLVLEGHDKQFLLNRLSLFIKQQQDFQKRVQRHMYDQNSTTTNSQLSQAINLDTIPPPLLPRAPRSDAGGTGSSERSSVEIKQLQPQNRMSDIGDI